MHLPPRHQEAESRLRENPEDRPYEIMEVAGFYSWAALTLIVAYLKPGCTRQWN